MQQELDCHTSQVSSQAESYFQANCRLPNNPGEAQSGVSYSKAKPNNQRARRTWPPNRCMSRPGPRRPPGPIVIGTQAELSPAAAQSAIYASIDLNCSLEQTAAAAATGPACQSRARDIMILTRTVESESRCHSGCSRARSASSDNLWTTAADSGLLKADRDRDPQLHSGSVSLRKSH